MAERLGEKSGWAFIQHIIDIVILPFGGFALYTIWNMSQALVQLQTNVANLSSQVAVLVSQSTYETNNISVERRLDKIEKDLDKVEEDMRRH